MEPINVKQLTEEIITEAAKVTGAPVSTVMTKGLFVRPEPMLSLGGVRAALILAAVELKDPTKSFGYIQRLVGPPNERPSPANMFQMLYATQSEENGTYPRLDNLDSDHGVFRYALKIFARIVGEITGDIALKAGPKASNVFMGIHDDPEWARAGAAALMLGHTTALRHPDDSIAAIVRLINAGYTFPD